MMFWNNMEIILYIVHGSITFILLEKHINNNFNK